MKTLKICLASLATFIAIGTIYFATNFNTEMALAFAIPSVVLGTPVILFARNYFLEQERRNKINELLAAAETLQELESSINAPAKDMRGILAICDLEDLININKSIEQIEVAIASLRKSYNMVGDIYADAGLTNIVANKGNNNKGNNNNNNNGGNNNNNNNNGGNNNNKQSQ
jgi:hypothetical protein